MGSTIKSVSTDKQTGFLLMKNICIPHEKRNIGEMVNIASSGHIIPNTWILKTLTESLNFSQICQFLANP